MKNPTASVAAPLARTLTDNGVVLTPRSDQFPVGVVATHYRMGIDPTYKRLSRETAKEIKERFEQENLDTHEQTALEQDAIAENMADGLRRMLVQVREVVIPYCKQVKETFDNIMEHQRLPVVRIKPYIYDPIHDDPTLTSHILEEYCNVRQRDSYRSFIIDTPSVEKMIEWIASNKHVDATTTKTWLTKTNEVDMALREAWSLLFSRRELIPGDSHGFQKGSLPFSVDVLLAAYLLTAHLCHDPQDVVGESVGIDDWDGALAKLHTYVGSLLCQAYTQRAKDRQKNRIVFRYDLSQTGPGGESVLVHTNGDTYNAWLEDGGDVKVLLGAAVASPTRMYASDFEGHQDDLVKRWDRKHYFLKQKALDTFLSERRDYLRDILVSWRGSERPEALPELPHSELTARVNREVACITEDHLDDPWRTIVTLVCDVFYPNTPYKGFLMTMDRTSKDHPNLSARESATTAVIEMTAEWLAKQLVAEPITLDTRDNDEVAVEPSAEEEPVTEEEADATTTDDTIDETDEVNDDTTVSA